MACVDCSYPDPTTNENEHNNSCNCDCHPPKMNVIMGSTWRDARLSHIADDAMLPLTAEHYKGIYYHHRLHSVVIVKQELPDEIASLLPD